MNLTSRKIKIGADPEIFLFKNGKPFSAIGTICGTKEHPQKISSSGHSVQVDNVLLEFNIPPQSTATNTYADIKFIMDWFRYKFTDEFTFKTSSSEIFSSDQLQHPDALKFGCDPDYNVWLEAVNIAPNAKTNLRSAGGHIHVSYPNASIADSLELVKLFDLYLGVPSVIYDSDIRRRKLYGKAGAFRFKNYPNDESGFEYRVLSNFWIKDLKNVQFIYNQIEKVFDKFYNGFRIERISKLGDMINKTINESNQTLAHDLIKEYNL